MSGNDDLQLGRTNFQPPHSARNPIPTVQKHLEYKTQQRENLNSNDNNAGQKPQGQGSEDVADVRIDLQDAYGNPKIENKLQDASRHSQTTEGIVKHAPREEPSAATDQVRQSQAYSPMEDTTQFQQSRDLKHYHNRVQKRKIDRIERDVTDPVTHLHIKIRDLREDDFKTTDRDYPSDKFRELTVQDAERESQAIYQDLGGLFPPPNFEQTREDLATIYRSATILGIGSILVIGWCTLIIAPLFLGNFNQSSWNTARFMAATILVLLDIVVSVAIAFVCQHWVGKKAKSIWEDQVWEADRKARSSATEKEGHEGVLWLNMLIGTIWPLVNPDLFTSLGDTLEDIMQASLPRFVRMVSVEDFGQGSEPVRILGVKYLPKGAAARSVSKDGKIQQGEQESPSEGTEQRDDHNQSTEGTTDKVENIADQSMDNDAYGKDDAQDDAQTQGLEAEEGEFLNIELALAFRSTPSHSDRDRTKNPHVNIAFYMPGRIKIPVWVELRGLVGTIRARLQLIPDPPFIAKCTLTILGQPRVELSCVPLIEKGLNLMDLPLLSKFVQTAVDAGLSQYVAPRSQTLNVKSMMSGKDFKQDTVAIGVLRIKIRRAYDFNIDGAKIPVISGGSSDAYVSIGWAKFGKPVWSTRVIVDEQDPYWEEVGYVLVHPEELDADERLRVQLWNSEKFLADNDLGRIELSLKDIIKNRRSNGQNWQRKDSFQSMNTENNMPGQLEWEVGYYPKTKLMHDQVERSSRDPNVNNREELKQKVDDKAEHKLKESSEDKTAEVEQRKSQDYKAAAIDLISNSPPSEDYPSGILSIQIHQIAGLQYEKQSKAQSMNKAEDDDVEGEYSLPSSYCTIILNHRKIYRTRTKPKNQQPFFNTVTERFIRDWRITSILISVRDSRAHEDDPLLGVICIPIPDIFRSRKVSKINESYPLVGGIGYGKLRVSLVFRSVQMQEPLRVLGWDYGTLEIDSEILSEKLQESLTTHSLRLRTSTGKIKARHSSDCKDNAIWQSSDYRTMRLAVVERYATNLVVEFRNSNPIFGEKVAAFAVLWLCNLPDEEWQSISVPVWKGNLKRAERCMLPEGYHGEHVGLLKIRLRFCRGLSTFHNKNASRNVDVQEVLEVLHCLHYNSNSSSEDLSKAIRQRGKKGEQEASSDSDNIDSESEGHQYANGGEPHTNEMTRTKFSIGQENYNEVIRENQSEPTNDQQPGAFLDPIKEYMNQKDELHARHRGILQWKAPRTFKWVKNKGKNAINKLSSVLDHQTREPDIETEV